MDQRPHTHDVEAGDIPLFLCRRCNPQLARKSVAADRARQFAAAAAPDTSKALVTEAVVVVAIFAAVILNADALARLAGGFAQ